MPNRPIRADITYITRRIKPVPPSAPAPDASTPRPAGIPLDLNRRSTPAAVQTGQPLDLRRPESPTAAQSSPEAIFQSRPGTTSRPVPARRATPRNRPFPAPSIEELSQLSPDNPMVRLNARQSAIGTLTVSGARSVTWEGSDLTTGAATYDGHSAGTSVKTPGNRPLAGFHDSAAVVALRHVRLLRRTLFIGAGGPLSLRLFDGQGITAAASADDDVRVVLFLARIGSLLELRAEFVPDYDSDPAIWEKFGLSMTIPLAAPVY